MTHVTWGSRRERVFEVDGLGALFDEVQDADRSEQDVILVGDFNVEPPHHAWARLLGLPGVQMLIAPPARTTLGRRGFVSLYDNLIVQRHHTLEWTGRAGSIDTTRLYAGNAHDTGARLSDHVPVWATFRTTGRDDD